MDHSRRRAADDPGPEYHDLAPLDEVRTELAELEELDRQVADLTAALRARLAPEQFRLVWALRDVVECRMIAGGLLRDRRLAGGLARELPARSAALEALRRRLLGDELPIDETD